MSLEGSNLYKGPLGFSPHMHHIDDLGMGTPTTNPYLEIRFSLNDNHQH